MIESIILLSYLLNGCSNLKTSFYKNNEIYKFNKNNTILDFIFSDDYNYLLIITEKDMTEKMLQIYKYDKKQLKFSSLVFSIDITNIFKCGRECDTDYAHIKYQEGMEGNKTLLIDKGIYNKKKNTNYDSKYDLISSKNLLVLYNPKENVFSIYNFIEKKLLFDIKYTKKIDSFKLKYNPDDKVVYLFLSKQKYNKNIIYIYNFNEILENKKFPNKEDKIIKSNLFKQPTNNSFGSYKAVVGFIKEKDYTEKELTKIIKELFKLGEDYIIDEHKNTFIETFNGNNLNSYTPLINEDVQLIYKDWTFSEYLIDNLLAYVRDSLLSTGKGEIVNVYQITNLNFKKMNEFKKKIIKHRDKTTKYKIRFGIFKNSYFNNLRPKINISPDCKKIAIQENILKFEEVPPMPPFGWKFVSDENYVNSKITIYELMDLKKKKIINTNGSVNIDFSDNSKYLAYSEIMSNNLKIYSLESNKITKVLYLNDNLKKNKYIEKKHYFINPIVRFLPNNNIIFSNSSKLEYIKLNNYPENYNSQIIAYPRQGIFGKIRGNICIQKVLFSFDSKYLMILLSNGNLSLYDIEHNSKKIYEEKGIIANFYFSLDSKFIIIEKIENNNIYQSNYDSDSYNFQITFVKITNTRYRKNYKYQVASNKNGIYPLFSIAFYQGLVALTYISKVVQSPIREIFHIDSGYIERESIGEIIDYGIKSLPSLTNYEFLTSSKRYDINRYSEEKVLVSNFPKTGDYLLECFDNIEKKNTCKARALVHIPKLKRRKKGVIDELKERGIDPKILDNLNGISQYKCNNNLSYMININNKNILLCDNINCLYTSVDSNLNMFIILGFNSGRIKILLNALFTEDNLYINFDIFSDIFETVTSLKISNDFKYLIATTQNNTNVGQYDSDFKLYVYNLTKLLKNFKDIGKGPTKKNIKKFLMFTKIIPGIEKNKLFQVNIIFSDNSNYFYLQYKKMKELKYKDSEGNLQIMYDTIDNRDHFINCYHVIKLSEKKTKEIYHYESLNYFQPSFIKGTYLIINKINKNEILNLETVKIIKPKYNYILPEYYKDWKDIHTSTSLQYLYRLGWGNRYFYPIFFGNQFVSCPNNKYFSIINQSQEIEDADDSINKSLYTNVDILDYTTFIKNIEK